MSLGGSPSLEAIEITRKLSWEVRFGKLNHQAVFSGKSGKVSQLGIHSNLKEMQLGGSIWQVKSSSGSAALVWESRQAWDSSKI